MSDNSFHVATTIDALKALYVEVRNAMSLVSASPNTGVDDNQRTVIVRHCFAKLDQLAPELLGLEDPETCHHTYLFADLWDRHGEFIPKTETVGVHSWSCHATLTSLAEISLLLSRTQRLSLSKHDHWAMIAPMLDDLFSKLEKQIVRGTIIYSGSREIRSFATGSMWSCRKQELFEAEFLEAASSRSSRRKTSLRLVHSISQSDYHR